MKCTTTREQILEPITHAEKSTGKNLTLPVLSCVLLNITDKELSITATNLEVGVRYTLAVGDTEKGIAAVSGSVLMHVIASLPSGAVLTLETNKQHLLIASAGATSRIALQDAEEFPVLPIVEDAVTVTLPGKELKNAIVSVAYCASNSTIKPELSSVFIHPNGSTLVAVATDSFRLAEKKLPLKEAVTCDPFLIPARSVGELVRVLEDTKDTVTLHINDHQLSLSLPQVYVTLRLTAGTFPDYSQIIPKEFSSEATALVFDVERVLKKASVFSDQFNQSTITIAPKKKQFSIHTENTNIGETTDTITAALTGENLVISFNQRYLLDALHSITSDSISIQFAGQSQPALIRPIGDGTFLYLVMPMNR